MQIALPANNLYGNKPVDIDFPDGWDVSVSSIRGAGKPAMTPRALSDRIRNPIGCAPVREAAKGKKNAVIIIDDMSRPTPAADISGILISELTQAGVPRDHIYFMAAVGMHRAMNREEFARKLGEAVVDEFRCFSHNPFMPGTRVGRTTHGLDVDINMDVMAAEFKIAIGTIMPHSLYGFGGGGKIILPGVASAETIRQNHLMDDVKAFSLAKLDTVNRSNATQAARMAGLDFKIDCLLNGQGAVSDLFAGDVEAVTASAVPFALSHYSAGFIAEADVVVANNYFKPSEANTAYTPRTIESLKKTGGDYVLSAHTPQGFAPHYLYSRWGLSDVGGFLWDGEFSKKPPIHRFIGFTSFMDIGTGESWFIDRREMVFKKHWKDVLRIIDSGVPRRAAVYPYGCAQII